MFAEKDTWGDLISDPDRKVTLMELREEYGEKDKKVSRLEEELEILNSWVHCQFNPCVESSLTASSQTDKFEKQRDGLVQGRRIPNDSSDEPSIQVPDGIYEQYMDLTDKIERLDDRVIYIATCAMIDHI